MAHLVLPSTALASLSDMCEKRESAPPRASQVKNRRKTIGIIKIIEKLRVIMRREKCEHVVDICHNVRLAHGVVHKICDNADRIKQRAKSGTEEFV
jgi:predicted ATP-dependent Lon-type protease